MGRIFARNWQIVGVRGLIAALLGLGALFWPAQTVTILKTMFAVFAIAYGALTLFGGLRNPEGRQNLPIIKGAAALIIGVIAILWPDITGLILLYLIAAYSLITGALDIMGASQLSEDQKSLRPFQLGSGIASVVFGVILLFQPGEGAVTQNVLIGIYFLALGGIGLFMSYRIRQTPKPLESAPV